MKRTKRGFTIVELVIVIAIIAILAAILVPTFSNVIDNAKKTTRQSEIKNTYTEYLSDNADDPDFVISAIDAYCYSKDGTNFYNADGSEYTGNHAATATEDTDSWDIYTKTA